MSAGWTRPKPEPIISTPLSQVPWSEIAVDLLEVLNKGHLLDVIDYYSKWPEEAFLSRTNAETVIKSLETMFRNYGLPEPSEMTMVHRSLLENLKISSST